MMEIFKIQRPLATNWEVPKALVYNEDHSVEFFIPVDDGILETFFVEAGMPAKLYVLGELKRGEFVIDEVVEEQDW
jgi:hypothetical protein